MCIYQFSLLGLFGSKQNWRSISKALHSKTKPCRKVFAVDARNHGESPHSPNHRYEDLAADIREFYREQNIEKAVLLGHSMGGRAMMAFALKFVINKNDLYGSNELTFNFLFLCSLNWWKKP